METVPHPAAPQTQPVHKTDPVTRIEARSGWQAVDFAELWNARELTWFLAVKDIRIRYKQAALGIGWAVLQPLLTTFLFTILFNWFAKVPSTDKIPYFIMVFCAQVPWQFFSNALTNAGNSLVTNQHLITKIYFPRLAIPISSALAGVLDVVITFALLLIMMACFQIWPTWAILTLPFFVILALVTSLGVGLLLAAVNVQYRDVRYTLPFIQQLWMLMTPVMYPISIVPEKWRLLYSLNPMVGVVEGFRWALLGTQSPGPMVFVSTVIAVVGLVVGAYYFRRMERGFADVV